MPSANTLLLVDDSRASRMLCAALLRHLRPELEIIEAGDGDSALERLATVSPALAVLDMNMPGMSGLELAELISNTNPTIRLALLTANVQESIQRRAAEMGVRFFRKPVTESVLKDILALLD